MAISDTMVVFHVSGSTYEIFDLVGKNQKGQAIWMSRANGKIVTRQIQDGHIVFWKSDKKAFYYKP